MQERTPVRTYAKHELAHLYNPQSPYSTAMDLFRKWINNNPDLRRELDATYPTPKAKYLSPRQVEIIFKYLGEP